MDDTKDSSVIFRYGKRIRVGLGTPCADFWRSASRRQYRLEIILDGICNLLNGTLKSIEILDSYECYLKVQV